jgi:hypothetical protein
MRLLKDKDAIRVFLIQEVSRQQSTGNAPTIPGEKGGWNLTKQQRACKVEVVKRLEFTLLTLLANLLVHFRNSIRFPLGIAFHL